MFQRLEGSKGSKATAVYHYLSKLIGWDVESIVLLVRALWSLCFVSLCIALDSFVDLRLYSPGQLNKFIAEWKGEKETIEKARAEFLGGSMTLSERVVSGESGGLKMRSAAPSAPKSSRGEAYDTGTRGDNASRYERIREGVQKGRIKASVRGLKAEGMSQMTAEKYLKRLQDEGVGYVNGHA
jgi:hypothetical protein